MHMIHSLKSCPVLQFLYQGWWQGCQMIYSVLFAVDLSSESLSTQDLQPPAINAMWWKQGQSYMYIAQLNDCGLIMT